MAQPSTASFSNIHDRFRQFADQWKEESKFMSNTTLMAMLRSYQGIIGIGPGAVPLLLEELQREPDFWFWALEAITNENPVPASALGNVDLMAQAWIDWGKQRGFIAV